MCILLFHSFEAQLVICHFRCGCQFIRCVPSQNRFQTELADERIIVYFNGCIAMCALQVFLQSFDIELFSESQLIFPMVVIEPAIIIRFVQTVRFKFGPRLVAVECSIVRVSGCQQVFAISFNRFQCCAVASLDAGIYKTDFHRTVIRSVWVVIDFLQHLLQIYIGMIR